MEKERWAVLGIDGGGSKTSTVCVSNDSKGDLIRLSSVKTPSTNWNSVGESKAIDSLHEGIDQATLKAGLTLSDIKAICLGMSGVDRPQDKEKVRGWISSHCKNPEMIVRVESDAVIALASGTRGSLCGIVVISGTGCIAMGYNNGQCVRSGGWGPALGDEGSGHYIGTEIISRVLAAHDGRLPPVPDLRDCLLQKLKLKQVDELIPWAYRSNAGTAAVWKQFADLAKIGADMASAGDQASLAILSNTADALISHITAVHSRLKLPGLSSEKEATFPLVLAGGNLTHNDSPLPEIIAEKAKKIWGTHCQIKFPTIDPAEAAALLSLSDLKTSTMARL